MGLSLMSFSDVNSHKTLGLFDLYCLTSCQKSFHFYGNVTTASEGQQNLVTLHDLQVGRSEILVISGSSGLS